MWKGGCLPTLLLVTTLALNCVPIIFDEGNEGSKGDVEFDLIQQVHTKVKLISKPTLTHIFKLFPTNT